MAGWTNLTPSAGTLAAGNAYLYESSGALMYQGTSGSAATLVNADGTTSAGGWALISSSSMSGAATINFSGISQSYKDLRIVVDSPTWASGTRLLVRFGTTAADTGNHYATTVNAPGSTTWTAISTINGIDFANAGTSSSARLYEFEIPEYANTTYDKFIRVFRMSVGDIVHGFSSWGAGLSPYNVGYVSVTSLAASNFTGGTTYVYGRS